LPIKNNKTAGTFSALISFHTLRHRTTGGYWQTAPSGLLVVTGNRL